MRKAFSKATAAQRGRIFEKAFRLVPPPCNTGGFENKYKLTERGDLMNVSFYCPKQNLILSTTSLPSNVTEDHLKMIVGFMSKEVGLPSNYLIFHNGSLVKFFTLNNELAFNTNQKVEANLLINFLYSKEVENLNG